MGKVSLNHCLTIADRFDNKFYLNKGRLLHCSISILRPFDIIDSWAHTSGRFRRNQILFDSRMASIKRSTSLGK